MAGDDYASVKDAVMGEVRNYFRPEFVNRIDEVVVFHALDEKHIQSIARIQLDLLAQRLARLDMKLQADESALSEVVRAGFDPVFGARPLKRAIQSRIENPLAKAILEGRFAGGDTIRVRHKDGAMCFEKG
jgi:ATP-dependent Clp protease ATP-binding subunit ClpB